jgi:hypothetical protein
MIPGFEKIVEERIRAAQKRGEFENLLEDRKSARIRELVDLARLLENDRIDPKTTDRTGRNLFN